MDSNKRKVIQAQINGFLNQAANDKSSNGAVGLGATLLAAKMTALLAQASPVPEKVKPTQEEDSGE